MIMMKKKGCFLSKFQQQTHCFTDGLEIEKNYKQKSSKKYLNCSQKHIKLLILILIFNLLIYSTNSIQSYSTQCHYSCQYCIEPQYSQCYVCKSNFQLTILSKQTEQSFFNTLEQYPKGSCIGALHPVNFLGIALLIFLIGALFATKNRVFFYFISSIQSLALISLLQIGYLNPLGYILQSFEWFMLLSNIQKFFGSYNYNLYNVQKYNLSNMFFSIDIQSNMILVGSISLLSFIFVFTIPIIRWVHKKFCLKNESQKTNQKQQNNKSITQMIQNSNIVQKKGQIIKNLSQQDQKQNSSLQIILKRLELIFAIVFFFTIQETILIFAVGIKYKQTQLASGDVIVIVVYGILMGLMISNQCLKQLRCFPNKLVQATDTLKKCTFSLFMIMPYDYGFFILIFLFFLNLIQVFCIKKLSIKEQYKLTALKTKSKFQFIVQYQQSLSRQFKYRLIEQASIVLIALFYVVDTLVKGYMASLICSIIAFIAFLIFLCCIFFQIGMEIRSKIQVQQKIIPESMQNRNQQKLQQRDHTQENIFTTSQGFVQTLFLNNFQNNTFQIQNQPPKILRKEHKQNVFNQQEIQQEKPRKMTQLQDLSQNVTHRSQKTQMHTPKHSTHQFPKEKQPINDEIPSPITMTPRSKPKRRDKNRIKSSFEEGQQQQKIQSLKLQKQKQNQFQSSKKLMDEEEQQQEKQEVPHFAGQQIKQEKNNKQSKKQEIEAILAEQTDPKKKELRQRYGMIKPVKKKQKNLDMITNN